ncbi:MAG: Zn-ribbon domain-containing OB-fold protein [Desulfatitalea sp.]|nr:Zn-ribbon domain-containing OB-fold protein [Desulfatitalea sp.]NNK02532.1 Zn-ribbon domain-containing OB-fold protein [Desulfatitalea sp.]
MPNWVDEVEPMTFKGQIAVPYTWWVGDTGSRFLEAIRDQATFLGTRCPDCDTVYVPPRKNCGRCFTALDQWVEIARRGVVTAFTIVRANHPLQPVKSPFAYALIRLDGASVSILHLITKDLARLSIGVTVEAHFKEASQRTGHILDIDHFQII